MATTPSYYPTPARNPRLNLILPELISEKPRTGLPVTECFTQNQPLMRKLIGLFAFAILNLSVFAQSPATVFTIPNRNILLPCGTGCTPISFSVPHIKQTNNYVITNPAYLPFAYTTPGGTTVTSVYNDDTWSQKIPFPFAFSFCFFGVNYPTLIMGSNSAISFDTTNPGP